MRILSERLILRKWIDADKPPFAVMSADPVAMEFLMTLNPEDAAGGWIDRQIDHLQRHGLCFWAVERKSDGVFVGAVGLMRVPYQAHFTPAVELGWRITREFWGLGYAPEAAEAAITFGFDQLDLPEIVANTVSGNQKSRRVMEKLGMTYDSRDEFDHARMASDHPMRRQVLYRLSQEHWRSSRKTSES